jgi:hypothetical protein
VSNTRKPATAVSGQNGDGVWDLDAYAAEAQKEPFRFRLGGTAFTVPHISDIDWLSVAGGEDFGAMPTGHELLKLALGDQWKAFTDIPLSSEGYNELQRRWHRHSGIDLGEQDASPVSSETTAGQ